MLQQNYKKKTEKLREILFSPYSECQEENLRRNQIEIRGTIRFDSKYSTEIIARTKQEREVENYERLPAETTKV